jgi:hypothetical protein
MSHGAMRATDRPTRSSTVTAAASTSALTRWGKLAANL